MLPGKVLQQSGNAHATPAEPADDGVQFVPHILTDEHRLAVPDLRDGEVRFPSKFPFQRIYFAFALIFHKIRAIIYKRKGLGGRLC